MGVDFFNSQEYQTSADYDETNPLADNPNWVPGSGYKIYKEPRTFTHNGASTKVETLSLVFGKRLLNGDTLNTVRLLSGLGAAAAQAAGIDLNVGDILKDWDSEQKDILSVQQFSRAGAVNLTVVEFGAHSPGQTMGPLQQTETNVVFKGDVYTDKELKHLTIMPNAGETDFSNKEPVKVFAIDSQTMVVMTHIYKNITVNVPNREIFDRDTNTKQTINDGPKIDHIIDQYKVDILKIDSNNNNLLTRVSSVNAMPVNYIYSFGTEVTNSNNKLSYRFDAGNFYFVSNEDNLTYVATPEGFKQVTGFQYKPELRKGAKFAGNLDLIVPIIGQEVYMFPVDSGAGGFSLKLWGFTPDVSGGGPGYFSDKQTIYPFGVKNVVIDNVYSFPKYDTDGVQTHAYSVVSYTQSGARMFAVFEHNADGKAIKYSILKGDIKSNIAVDVSLDGNGSLYLTTLDEQIGRASCRERV